MPDRIDQQQKRLQLTMAGSAFWDHLPDLNIIREMALADSDPAEIEITIRVLRRATKRLKTHISKGKTKRPFL